MARKATPTAKPKKWRTPAPAQKSRGEPIGADGLTDKQRVFVMEYLTCWNAAEAARRAGYSAKTARSIGAENLTKPDIRAAVEKRITELAMGPEEVLARLADMARADMNDFFTTYRGRKVFSLKAAAAAGKLHLVKKYRLGLDSESVELHDAQAALVQIGRHLGMFVDRQEHTGKDGGPIDVRDMEAVRQKRWAQASPALKEAAAGEAALSE